MKTSGFRGVVTQGLTLAAVTTAIVTLSPSRPAQAQAQYMPCLATGQPLLRIPEIVHVNGKLNGVMTLSVEANRMKLFRGSGDNCVAQFVRAYRAVNGTLPDYPGAIPAGFAGATPPQPPSQYADPMPGPTLRGKVGGIVQLTFLNQIDVNNFPYSIDRGEKTGGTDPQQGCDQSSAPYPAIDTFPDCFHGSSTGNIHFHGTHTSPSSTGDNVFLEIRPSPRLNGQPVVTEASVAKDFKTFFDACEAALAKSATSQFPATWSDLPQSWVTTQETLLKAYDAIPANGQKLWPTDEAQLKAGLWPQYYIGAYPYCFQLPQYGSAVQPGQPPLIMGQAPGLHWYHAHKHGSTTINVSNGMTGAFVIEGQYDADLDAYYGAGWMRKQPILLINQLGVSPNLYAGQGGGPAALQVNGRPQPTVTMNSGEVQMFRIANAASRSGAYFVGPPTGFAWKQIAQDGVQFSPDNYWNNQNQPFLMASGNRVDLLVKAPINTTNAPQTFAVRIRQAINASQTTSGSLSTLFSIVVQPGAAPTGPGGTFVPKANAPAFPSFLADIAASEVSATKTVTFKSENPPSSNAPPANAAPFVEHTINGKKFDGVTAENVKLNTVEEWKIVNATPSSSTLGPGPINHPFHIHINPFQVVEIFDPTQTQYIISTTSPATTANPIVPGTTYRLANNQCWVDPNAAASWQPCVPQSAAGTIWWDVFPMPNGVTTATNDASGKPITIPGYFKMRSRFVDFAGQFVIHCHILAHEDRGMMMVVSVGDIPKLVYSHH